MPNTGPSEGSRRQMTAFLPMWLSASPRPTVVVVLPSPGGRRADRRDQDQLAVRLVLQRVDVVERRPWPCSGRRARGAPRRCRASAATSVMRCIFAFWAISMSRWAWASPGSCWLGSSAMCRAVCVAGPTIRRAASERDLTAVKLRRPAAVSRDPCAIAASARAPGRRRSSSAASARRPCVTAHRAVLELGDLAERVERRVGQQVGRRLVVAERDEDRAARRALVGARVQR